MWNAYSVGQPVSDGMDLDPVTNMFFILMERKNSSNFPSLAPIISDVQARYGTWENLKSCLTISISTFNMRHSGDRS